jgi:arylformamidase
MAMQDQSPTRRTVLSHAVAGAAVIASGAASAQPAPAARVKGPLVWLDMDQQALDDAYDQAVYAPNAPQLHKRRQDKCKEVRARLGEPRRLAYGPTPVEMLDIYTTKKPNAPINVFIHGGAWRAGEAWEFCDAAELFVHAGAHFVVPDFIDVIAAGGSLMPMAEQVRRAVAWVHKNAASFGGDPSRIFISGRSSGAHLAGTTLIADGKEFGAPADVIKGALLSSGMYDLKPVRLSKRGAYVKFTDAMEDALSTQRHLTRINCPVIVAHGTYETPEFQRQTRDFAAALKAAGKPVTLLTGHYNHFEMPETLQNPYGLLGRAVLEQMKLTAQG